MLAPYFHLKETKLQDSKDSRIYITRAEKHPKRLKAKNRLWEKLRQPLNKSKALSISIS